MKGVQASCWICECSFDKHLLKLNALKVLCLICIDNTKLELPSKRRGLRMAFSGKITNISCQIDISDCNQVVVWFSDPFTNFVAAQRFNQFNFGHYKKWAIDVDKCSCTCYSWFCVITNNKKDVSQSLNSVWQWSLEGKRVSLHNLNTRTTANV